MKFEQQVFMRLLLNTGFDPAIYDSFWPTLQSPIKGRSLSTLK